MRLRMMLKKELRCSRENISFHLVSVISPLLFIFAFTLMLSGGITFPLQVYSEDGSDFADFLADYRSPSGERYFEIEKMAEPLHVEQMHNNVLAVRQDVTVKDDAIAGDLTFYINDANANMTKNYRNRLHGALLSFIHTHQRHPITVLERTRYPTDIAWDKAFGVSVFAFGVALSGLLFGMLAMTHEWEDGTHIFIKLSPRSGALLLVAKGLAALLKSAVSSAVFIGVYLLLFREMPLHPGWLLVTVMLSAAIFICLGMLIGHYIKSTITSFLISIITALTLWIGGGGFGPLSYYGSVANFLGKLNPLTYSLEMLRFTYFAGNVRLGHHPGWLGLFALGGFAILLAVFQHWCKKEVA